jgi:hypothetical protein
MATASEPQTRRRRDSLVREAQGVAALPEFKHWLQSFHNSVRDEPGNWFPEESFLLELMTA